MKNLSVQASGMPGKSASRFGQKHVMDAVQKPPVVETKVFAAWTCQANRLIVSSGQPKLQINV